LFGGRTYVWGRRTLSVGREPYLVRRTLSGEENLVWGGEPCLGEENLGFKKLLFDFMNCKF
jgi:hypothetical protein